MELPSTYKTLRINGLDLSQYACLLVVGYLPNWQKQYMA
jgi:hypothetical protein